MAEHFVTLTIVTAVSILGWFLRRESVRVDRLERNQHLMQLELAKNSEQNRQLFAQVSQMREDLKGIATKLDRLIERQ